MSESDRDDEMVSIRLDVTSPAGERFGAWLAGDGFSKAGVVTFLIDGEDETRCVPFRQVVGHPVDSIWKVERASRV